MSWCVLNSLIRAHAASVKMTIQDNVSFDFGIMKGQQQVLPKNDQVHDHECCLQLLKNVRLPPLNLCCSICFTFFRFTSIYAVSDRRQISALPCFDTFFAPVDPYFAGSYALGRSTRSFYYPATKLLTLRGAMALHMYFPGFPTAVWLKFATLICTKASEGSSSRAAACLANHGVHFERRCYNIEHLLDYILLFDALADGY